MTQPTEYEQASYNDSGGAQFGRTSTDLISFYGATPVARPLTALTLDVSTVSTNSISTLACVVTSWMFQSQAEINNFINAVSTMQYTMKQLGLIA